VHLTPARVAILATAIGMLVPSPLLAATTPTPSAVAQATPAPKASAKPLTIGGFARSYYFTRQNASQNPGVQYVLQGDPAKYNSNAVNQATWNTAVALHFDYRFPGMGGFYVGASYLYANPAGGACVVAANHTAGGAAASGVVPACNKQLPPALDPDDTLPGFALSTLYEAYVAFKNDSLYAKVGDQIFTSPWANAADTRLKPAAYQGGDIAYVVNKHWNVEAADMTEYENRTSSTFNDSTLLTSYSAGAPGLPSNLANPKCFNTGCVGFNTNGFFYGKAGYANAPSGLSANGYFYGISNLNNIWWFDGTYQLPGISWKPYVSLQGGTNNNAGSSYLGKIDSQAFGIKIGAYAARNLQVSLGMDTIPWKTDTITLPSGVSCSSSGATPTYQIKNKPGTSLQYFLASNNAQCSNNSNGTTNIYYGGWASPYTDSYTSDPFYTTSISQGMVERRSGGTSFKATAIYTSTNKRLVFLASDAWYNYGNAGAPNYTNEWDLDGTYHFNYWSGSGPYKGFQLRDRYMNRTDANTYYTQGTTSACTAPDPCSQLGGIPLFKYNRIMLEYDF
jgi:hypothetical protein